MTEALSAGTSVITTVGAPWSGLETAGAGWWVEQGVDALAACLREARATEPQRLQEMGRRGRRWMQTDFVWADAGRRVARTYDWLRGRAERPAWVRT